MSKYKWSQVAATNATADSTINWAEGQAPSSVNDSARAQMAASAKERDDHAGALTTGGTTTAFTLTSNQVFASLSAMSGQKLKVRFNATNGAAPTLNVDTLGAKAIQTASGTAVATGAILANSVHDLTYDNSIPAWLLSGSFGGAFSGNVTIGGTLVVTGASTFSAAIAPTSSDGAALGSTSLMWSDLFLASGAVINFNNGDVTVTHSANTLAFAGGTSYTFDATLTASSGFTVSAGAVSFPAASVAEAALVTPGKMKLIFSQTASSSAMIDFNATNSASAFNGTHDHLVLRISNVKPATDDVNLRIQVGTGAGPTYQTTGYQYQGYTVGGGILVDFGSTVATGFQLMENGGGAGVGNAAGEHIRSTIEFDSPDATDFLCFTANSTFVATDANFKRSSTGGGWGTAGAVTAIRLLFSSGNIASGVFSLYGMKNT